MLKMDAVITSDDLPGSSFFSKSALDDHAHHASQYESAVDAYERDGEPSDLWQALTALGFEPCEIRWHADRRGERMEVGYA
jgi:hypothetical protein